jgi:hypothetical protein
MSRAVEAGPRFADGAYRGATWEREARAFAGWAVARLEAPGKRLTGWREWLRKRLLPPHERLFEAAWDGRLARRAMARGWVPLRRLSDAAKRAREATRAAVGPAALRRHPDGIGAA